MNIPLIGMRTSKKTDFYPGEILAALHFSPINGHLKPIFQHILVPVLQAL
jgi:hypothetical protein